MIARILAWLRGSKGSKGSKATPGAHRRPMATRRKRKRYSDVLPAPRSSAVVSNWGRDNHNGHKGIY